MKQWSRKFDKCIDCGSTENKHKSLGRCTSCIDKYRYKNNVGGIKDRKKREGKRRYLAKIYPRTKLRYKSGIDFRSQISSDIKTNSAQYRALVRELYRKKLLDIYGGKCAHCGFSDYRALQIDHIGNNGWEERKTLNHDHLMYKLLESQDKKNYQLLCANCNWIKHYNNTKGKNGK